MRMFSIIALVLSVLIVGWLAAGYLASVTGSTMAVQMAPSVTGAAPETDGGGPVEVRMTAPIDRANEIASMDQERQRQMQKQMDELMR